MELDQIKIEGLEIFANHGVFPEENVLGQKFIVSATLYTDTRKAGKTDELTASIHYGEVSAFITEFVKSHTYKLLERVAEELVEDMLQKFDGLEKVTLEIQKPWAPVGLPLKTVSVRITRSWHTAYIALGSNMGDSRQILDDAVSAIDALPASKVEKVSGFITTPPYGVTDQPDFLNGCLRMKTLYYPRELLRELNRIETFFCTGAFGGNRTIQTAPGKWKDSTTDAGRAYRFIKVRENTVHEKRKTTCRQKQITRYEKRWPYESDREPYNSGIIV